jgi:hypothetical protein
VLGEGGGEAKEDEMHFRRFGNPRSMERRLDTLIETCSESYSELHQSI